MNEHISQILKHRATLPAAIGVGSLVVGAVGGYILGRRTAYVVAIEEANEQLQLDFTMTTSDNVDITEVKVNGETRVKPAPIIIDAEEYERQGQEFLASKLEEAMNSSHESAEDPDLEHRTIFAESDEEWDYEKELANRDPLTPYILHKDEFFEDEKGFTQTTLTYYAGDDILVDENDAPVYNYRNIIGELRFGHGSGDPNVFYVRNESRKAEWEIMRDSGLYSVEVLGMEIENNERVKDLKHASVLRFRSD